MWKIIVQAKVTKFHTFFFFFSRKTQGSNRPTARLVYTGCRLHVQTSRCIKGLLKSSELAPAELMPYPNTCLRGGLNCNMVITGPQMARNCQLIVILLMGRAALKQRNCSSNVHLESGRLQTKGLSDV